MPKLDIIREFKAFSNIKNPLVEGFSKLYTNKEKHKELSFEIPSHIGNGRCSRIILNDDLEIYNNYLETKKNMDMGARTNGEIFLLSICTGEGMEWIESDSKSELQMNKGEAILYQVNSMTEIATYTANCYYEGITIMIKPDRFNEFLSSISCNKSIFNKDYKNFKINKFTLPVESKIVIEQIVNCPYNNSIKNMYLEGKSIELLSICLHNIMEKDINNIHKANLSKTDLQSLYKAKEILDNSISDFITITELSKLVCLNEFKLKTGFKEVFGKPVYTYHLDRRMELARFFLEINHISVNEVANMVGYSNSSSFSKAFTKKYGFNPSDCLYSVR